MHNHQFIIYLISCFLSISSLSAAALPFHFEGGVGVGYRQDYLRWSMAGQNHQPNILSELTWKDIEIALVETEGILEVCRFYARGRADYGRIFHGHDTDQDFGGDDRTELFSSSCAKADSGEVYDFSFGIGYAWEYCGLHIAPLGGYSHQEQHFEMCDLFNEVNLISNVLGPIKGLDSSYRARWTGPWLGFDFDYSLKGWPTLFGSFEYHWGDYFGKGHWNLRRDFIKDFRQCADNVHGQKYIIGLEHLFACHWGVNIVATYQNWKTGSGIDRVFLLEGAGDSPFNGAKWHSYSIVGAVSYIF